MDNGLQPPCGARLAAGDVEGPRGEQVPASPRFRRGSLALARAPRLRPGPDAGWDQLLAHRIPAGEEVVDGVLAGGALCQDAVDDQP